MFIIEEVSGALIRSGKLYDAIRPFYSELDMAHAKGVISKSEMEELFVSFCLLLLRPDAKHAAHMGTKMLQLALRIPDYLEKVGDIEFNDNVEESRS